MGRIEILVAEDDASIRALVQLALTKNGYACTTAADGQEAARLIEERRFDLALLDIMLPHIDGYDLLTYLKEYDTPAIFLTAKGSVEDRVHGLRLGAEDYLVKPFAVAELIARIEAVLRRLHKVEAHLTYRNIAIDTVSHTVTRGGQPVELTLKEYEILLLLMRNRGAALYRETIYEQVWREPWYGDTRTVDLHIQRLRKKLGLSEDIRSVYKVGYRLAAEDT